MVVTKSYGTVGMWTAARRQADTGPVVLKGNVRGYSSNKYMNESRVYYSTEQIFVSLYCSEKINLCSQVLAAS